MKSYFCYLIIMVVLLAACSGEAQKEYNQMVIATSDAKKTARANDPLRVPTPVVSTGANCTPSKYRSQAEPLMNEFGRLLKGVDLHDSADIQSNIDRMNALLGRVNKVSCRNQYPLKHETLEYSIRHMLDALEYALDGDLANMQAAINRSELNINQFVDWDADM